MSAYNKEVWEAWFADKKQLTVKDRLRELFNLNLFMLLVIYAFIALTIYLYHK